MEVLYLYLNLGICICITEAGGCAMIVRTV